MKFLSDCNVSICNRRIIPVLFYPVICSAISLLGDISHNFSQNSTLQHIRLTFFL